MASKIKVYGKAQNRTALGIINAYLVINPKATLSDLETAFPASLNSGLSAYKLTSSFLTPAIRKGRDDSKIRCCFEDEPITLSNGSTIYLFSLWQKGDLDKTIELAKQYDIEVADCKPAEGFQKGGYNLEYLNGFTPVVAKKGSKLWLIILLLLIIGALAAFFLLGKEEEQPMPVEKPVVVEQVVVEQVKEIQTKFNNVQFDKNSAELKDASKTVLTDIIALMTEHVNIKLDIIGHTSNEGEAKANQILSELRAKTAADFIVSGGIDQSRISSQGKGSSEPIDTNGLDMNRRIEFVIIK